MHLELVCGRTMRCLFALPPNTAEDAGRFCGCPLLGRPSIPTAMRPTLVLAKGSDRVNFVGPTPVLQMHRPNGTTVLSVSVRQSFSTHLTTPCSRVPQGNRCHVQGTALLATVAALSQPGMCATAICNGMAAALLKQDNPADRKRTCAPWLSQTMQTSSLGAL